MRLIQKSAIVVALGVAGCGSQDQASTEDVGSKMAAISSGKDASAPLPTTPEVSKSENHFLIASLFSQPGMAGCSFSINARIVFCKKIEEIDWKNEGYEVVDYSISAGSAKYGLADFGCPYKYCAFINDNISNLDAKQFIKEYIDTGYWFMKLHHSDNELNAYTFYKIDFHTNYVHRYCLTLFDKVKKTPNPCSDGEE